MTLPTRPLPNKKNDTQSISVRLPAELVDMMDECTSEWNMNRSKLIAMSILEYVTSNRCASCGALNPSAGRICSVCGQVLGRDDKFDDALLRISERIISESGLPSEMPGGYHPHFVISETMDDRTPRYSVNYVIHSPDGDVLIPADKKTVFEIQQQDIATEMMEKEYSVELSNGKKMKVIFED